MHRLEADQLRRADRRGRRFLRRRQELGRVAVPEPSLALAQPVGRVRFHIGLSADDADGGCALVGGQGSERQRGERQCGEAEIHSHHALPLLRKTSVTAVAHLVDEFLVTALRLLQHVLLPRRHFESAATWLG